MFKVGGDIHCGVTSVIRDAETGMKIDHLTTRYLSLNGPDPNPRYSSAQQVLSASSLYYLLSCSSVFQPLMSAQAGFWIGG